MVKKERIEGFSLRQIYVTGTYPKITNFSKVSA